MTKRVAVLAAIVPMLAALVVLGAAPAGAQADFPGSAAFSGYSTGTVLHVDALQAAVAGPRLADTEVAFSGASTGSPMLGSAVINEMSQSVSPATAVAKNSSARGSALEVGLGTSTPNDPNANQIVLQGQNGSNVSAVAPPSTGLNTAEVGPIPAGPLAYASALRGQAQALWNPDACIVGQPISYGLGYAADAQLLDTGTPQSNGQLMAPVVATDRNNPANPAVSQSNSFTYLVNNGDGTWGLASETDQVIAPITLFKGTANEVTIQLLGVWSLVAVASGHSGGAKVTFQPGGQVSPNTPVLSIIQPHSSPPVNEILKLQDILGNSGLQIPANPLVSISIGEAPRAIAKPGALPDATSKPTQSADGTLASGAIDVVRVNLLQPDATGGLHALDLRIGHEEAKAQVPAGGIICHIPVNKTAFPDPVIAGSGASSSTPASCAAYPGCFTWTISIPTDAHSLDGLACDLVHIKVDDVASVKEAPDPHHPPKFTIISASNGGVVQGDSVSWADVGSYHPGNPPIQLVISGSVPADSGPGLLEDIVNVSAGLGNCTGGTQGSELLGNARLVGTALTNSNAATGNSLVRGQFTLEGPHVQAGAELPRTGDNPNRAPLGLALAGAGAIAFIVRRRLTHRPADNA